MDVITVSAVEFQRDLGHYQDLALHQPVEVVREGGTATVLISTEEYRRLKRRDREVLGLEDFTDADIVALETAHPPPEAAAFDDELNQ